MRMSDKGIELLKGFEGLRLSAYRDSGGVPTIGYGHTKNVEMDDVITQEQAEDFLRNDVHEAELEIQRDVFFGLAPHQFDALVSLAYNIGNMAFRKSTLLKKLNASDILGAANQFLMWKYVKGKVSTGLVARRKKERDIFLTGYK